MKRGHTKKRRLSWTHKTGDCDEKVKVLVQLIAHNEIVFGIKKKVKIKTGGIFSQENKQVKFERTSKYLQMAPMSIIA